MHILDSIIIILKIGLKSNVSFQIKKNNKTRLGILQGISFPVRHFSLLKNTQTQKPIACL